MKAKMRNKGGLVFLGETADDHILDWIEDASRKVDKMKSKRGAQRVARDHGDLSMILTNYTIVLLGGKDRTSCIMRRLYKDFELPNGYHQSLHRPAFGSKHFSPQQWTRFWREWLQIHQVRARKTGAQDGSLDRHYVQWVA